VNDDLDIRRKRLRYRCWHRGTRELDLLLGRFVDAALATMDARDLDRLEALIEVPEPILYSWVTGHGTPPPAYDHDLFRRLRAFHRPSERF